MGMAIEVGGVYANAGGALARKVLAIEKGDVEYCDYRLRDGLLMSSSRVCSRAVFRKWVARPCTPEEIASLSEDEIGRDERRLVDMVSLVMPPPSLGFVSDEELIAEVRRRGLSLEA